MLALHDNRCLWVTLDEVVDECLPIPADRQRFWDGFHVWVGDKTALSQICEMRDKARTWPQIGRFRLLFAAHSVYWCTPRCAARDNLKQINVAVSHLSTQSRAYVLACLMGAHTALYLGFSSGSESAESYLTKTEAALRFGGDDVQSLWGRFFLASTHVHGYHLRYQMETTTSSEEHLRAGIEAAGAAVAFYCGNPPMTPEPIRRLHLALAVTNLASMLMTANDHHEVDALLGTWEPFFATDLSFTAYPFTSYWHGLQALVQSRPSEACAPLMDALERCINMRDYLLRNHIGTDIISHLGDALVASRAMPAHESELNRILHVAAHDMECGIVNSIQVMMRRASSAVAVEGGATK